MELRYINIYDHMHVMKSTLNKKKQNKNLRSRKFGILELLQACI